MIDKMVVFEKEMVVWYVPPPHHPPTAKSHVIELQQTCILVFTTSTGVLPKTLAAPAIPPMINVFMEPMSLLGSPP